MKNKRIERKWVFNKADHILVLNLLLRSNFFFKNQYPPRKINSIYFDNNNLSNITQNLDGISNRVKYRVRWYGKVDNLIKPNFEIKKKKNFETQKKTIPLKNFNNINYNNEKNLNYLTEFINNKIVFNRKLLPTLLVCYNRNYLISSNNLIRATIDYEIKSQKLLNFKNDFFCNFKGVILEFKYDSNLDQIVRSMFNNIKVRYSKNSKYVNCALNNVESFS
jgi:SPX domain protein involved in polyphosphate accumulation